MWRSWVDRINSSASNGQPTSPTQPTISPEDAKRRKEAEAHLHDLWQQSQDLLSGDKDRSDVFIHTFLPAFCHFYDNEQDIGSFGFIQDARVFLSFLTRQLVSGIRSVPEYSSKAESSQALMDNLRSKSHLYHILCAIRTVAHGPESVARFMPQLRIPSVIIKLFRSFLDIPAKYYQSENNGDGGDSDSDVGEDDMVSIDQVGDICTDILKCFVNSSFILHHLVSEDSLFTVVRITSFRPKMDGDFSAENSEDGMAVLEPIFASWRKRAKDILVAMPMTVELAQYLHSKRSVEMLVQSWERGGQRKAIVPLDYERVAMDLDLISYQVKESLSIGYSGLLEELQNTEAYSIIASYIRSSPYTDSVVEFKQHLCQQISDLVLIGETPTLNVSTESIPYQHENFTLPSTQGSQDPLVRNLNAFQCLLDCLATSSYKELTVSSSPDQWICSPQLQEVLFSQIKDIIFKHPLNYFIIASKSNGVLKLIETIEMYTDPIQNGIIDILSYAMEDLNFVPVKEFAVLSLHFQSSSSSGRIIPLICQRLTTLFHKSEKYLAATRETGFLSVLCSLLSDIAQEMQRLSLDGKSQSIPESQVFVRNVLDNFDTIVNCLLEMMKDLANVTALRKAYRGNLFDLLRFPQTRDGALRLFERLSTQPANDTTAESPPSSSMTDFEFAFSKVIETVQSMPRDDIKFRMQLLTSIENIFELSASNRDVFRRIGGYVCLMSMIVSLEDTFRQLPETPEITEQRSEAKTLLQKIFKVLLDSTHDSDTNKHFFDVDVGYEALENALRLTGALEEDGIPRSVFNMLFAFTLEDPGCFDLIPDDISVIENDLCQQIEHHLKKIPHFVRNPQCLTTILNLQLDVSFDPVLSQGILTAISVLAESNRRNLITICRSKMLMTVLQRAFPISENNNPQQDTRLQNLTFKLVAMGINYNELRYIIQSFAHNGSVKKLEDQPTSDLLDILLQSTSRSRWPNFFQFDSGPSIEIASIPSFGSTSGYSLMMWFHIERQDTDAPLTLMSMADDQVTAFQVYVDNETRYLCVQTPQKQTITFDAFEFHPGFWYHLTLVHTKSRLGSSLSVLAMYINGVLIDQMRCAYISQPNHGDGYHCYINGEPSPSSPQGRVVWNLGPTFLVQDVLDAETVDLLYKLGARYESLFQDTLRQFHTYEASTSLFLNLRTLSKVVGKREANHSSLVNVMRGNTQPLVSENKFALALFASNSLSQGRQMGLFSLKLDDATLRTIMSSDPAITNMVLNAALPRVELAMGSPERMGRLVGSPLVACPAALDEGIWKVGGCAVALKFIERAESSSSLLKATTFLFEIIRYSWRNSEEMEHCHGYEILAYLLKQKRDYITVELLEQLLVFIGKDTAYPEESVINNPFAYRYIVLNFEIWKKTNKDVQRTQLEQFDLFLQLSKRKHFNIRRLQKIHLVKKMLLAFRMNVYAKELIHHVVKALKTVMLASWSAENIRAVATFLASTVSLDVQPTGAGGSVTIVSQRGRSTSVSGGLQSATARSFDLDAIDDKAIISDSKSCNQSAKYVQMRNIVLEMLHDILCDPANDEHVKRFAAIITNRWTLLFFAQHTNPYTVVLAARIMARVMVTMGPTYVTKFRTTTDGLFVLGKLLMHHWNLTQLYEALVIMMMGCNIAHTPLAPAEDVTELRKSLSMQITAAHTIPDILPIIISLWDEVVKKMALANDEQESGLSGRESPSASTPSLEHHWDPLHESNEFKFYNSLVVLIKDIYISRPYFREICCRAEVFDPIVEILYPSVCNAAVLSIDDELDAKDTGSIDSESLDDFSEISSPTSSTPTTDTPSRSGSIIRRGTASSLMTKTSPHVRRKTDAAFLAARFLSADTPRHSPVVFNMNNSFLESLVDLLVTFCVQPIIDPQGKPLPVFSIALLSYPPSNQDSQMTFQSFLLAHIAQNLKSAVQCQLEFSKSAFILNNMARFCQITSDAVLQGWFINGVDQTYDLVAAILERLHSSDYESRLDGNDQAIMTLYNAFNRMVLFKISLLEQGNMAAEPTVAFLGYCIHHQKIMLSRHNLDMEFMRCFCYHLYHLLLSEDETVKDNAANLWKLLILQKPDVLSNIFTSRFKEQNDLAKGFQQMFTMDSTSFFEWLESNQVELNLMFREQIYKSWENIISYENKHGQEATRQFKAKREKKLKKLLKNRYLEEEAIQEYATKTKAWSENIRDVEHSRFSKALQDNDGHENFIHSEWSKLSSALLRERAIWGPEISQGKFCLDFTEGRHRMRKKIQRIDDLSTMDAYLPKYPSTNGGGSMPSGIVEPIPLKPESLPLNENNEPPPGSSVLDPEENKAMTEPTTPVEQAEGDSEQRSEDESDEVEGELTYEEDKNRKVLRLLDQGDMVVDVYNTSQIVGLDAKEGLLLLCKNNIYIIDNFFQRADGEVVEIWDVPQEERDQYIVLLAQAAGIETGATNSSNDLHICRKWQRVDLREVYKRRFLFRDVALELFFADGQNALLTVVREERDDLYSKLLACISTDDSSSSIFGATDRDSLSAVLGSAFKFSIFGSSTLTDLAHKWQRREITNFQYLMYLNTIAGRSYNDLTQYPVFPWILADYTSDELDLSNPSTFRDLTKPMGAQTEERRVEFCDRYRQWGETDDPAPAFHYGTHYSSAMIVCSFLIRLEPFTHHYLKLQGGTFDHADRLFDSVGKAWESASEKNMGDVRELIPEFFYLPDFLINVNKFNFGIKQGTGEAIDSVILPPWAGNDPKIFIERHREALESDYVSEHLHHWIDLIFGYKQQGKTAIDAMNVFHHVSYEGAVDLDAITDTVEKTATIGIINNFGQTPRQLFKKPHPVRVPAPTEFMQTGYACFEDHVDKLIQSIQPLRDIHRQVGDVRICHDRLAVTANQQLFLPPNSSRYIEWGYLDNSLRLYATDSSKLIHVYENMHVGYINAACSPDERTLVTGGTDNVVCMWKIQHEDNTFSLMECLRGHTREVTALATSRSFSILVSGSTDKTAIVWDLNRMTYVRSLRGHEDSIQSICINDVTGDIVTCSGHIIRVWTINGDLYLTRSACPSSESILSCAIYEGKPNDWSRQDLIATGHRHGIVKIWAKHSARDSRTGRQEWTLSLCRQIQIENRIQGLSDPSDIVSLCFPSMRRMLLTGSRNGKVHSFVLPDCVDTIHYQREDKSKECMTCRKTFSVLERKGTCRTCGGIFCSSCMSAQPVPTPDRSARFCKVCAQTILNMVSPS